MAAKLILFLAVLKLTSSDPMPEPDPNVNVNVEVNVYDNNGKGGLCCTFGDKSYADGDYLKDTCLEMKCCKGTWKCTGKGPRAECGQCLAHGDPHIVPYEAINIPYTENQTGEFVLTQPGFSYSALFGVNANFETCVLRGAPRPVRSCIRSITYYEPGITVTLTLPPSEHSGYYCSLNPANANEPNCSIALCVNGVERPTPGCEADSCIGTGGTVFIFQQNYISGPNDYYCIAIVGSKGLSMALCQHHKDFPWFYIYAMPSLKHVPSLLEGLCDEYTGYPPTCYTMRNGTITCDHEASVKSWEVTPVVNCP